MFLFLYIWNQEMDNYQEMDYPTELGSKDFPDPVNVKTVLT